MSALFALVRTVHYVSVILLFGELVFACRHRRLGVALRRARAIPSRYRDRR